MLSTLHPNTAATLVIVGPILLLTALLVVGFAVDAALTYRKAKSKCLLDAFERYYAPAVYPADERARS